MTHQARITGMKRVPVPERVVRVSFANGAHTLRVRYLRLHDVLKESSRISGEEFLQPVGEGSVRRAIFHSC